MVSVCAFLRLISVIPVEVLFLPVFLKVEFWCHLVTYIPAISVPCTFEVRSSPPVYSGVEYSWFQDTIWFLQVSAINLFNKYTKETDDYGHEIAPGMVYNSGYFLEKNAKYTSIKSTVFTITKKSFFLENMSYIHMLMCKNKRMDLP